MDTEKYIILSSREISAPSRGDIRRAFGAEMFSKGGSRPIVKLEETYLTKRERNYLRNDPSTCAIAKSMPMKLIAPVSSSLTDIAATTATNAWGIDAVRASESPFDGTGITVAVLDTGIDPNHTAFKDVNLVQQNFTAEDGNDLHGHGTHCAGTIFGQDVNGIRIGIARNIKRALIGKVLDKDGASSATAVAKAIQWALQEGANVISMSLGIDFPGYVEWLVQENDENINVATSMALEGYRANVNLFSELARLVVAHEPFRQGAIIVAASGNESNRPHYEIAVSPPAASTGIIAVGALNRSDQGFTIAEFSNNQANIVAPGVNILSAKAGTSDLVNMSGTSMATPHAAGIAALWAQRQLDMTRRVDNQRMMAQLIGSGIYTSLAPDWEEDDVGTGIIQAPLS